MTKVAVIIPSYEQRDLVAYVASVRKQLATTASLWPQSQFDYWLIDDGADEATHAAIHQLKALQPEQVHVIALSRHFGFEAAVQAGLASIQAELYVIIDPAYPKMVSALPELLAVYFTHHAEVGGFTPPLPERLWQSLQGPHTAPIYHYSLMTQQVRVALLKTAARQGFSLSLLKWVGFAQRYLPWQGRVPRAPENIPWWRFALVLILAVLLAILPIPAWLSLLLNAVQLVVLLGITWRPKRRPPAQRYVIRQIQR